MHSAKILFLLGCGSLFTIVRGSVLEYRHAEPILDESVFAEHNIASRDVENYEEALWVRDVGRLLRRQDVLAELAWKLHSRSIDEDGLGLGIREPMDGGGASGGYQMGSGGGGGGMGGGNGMGGKKGSKRRGK